MAADPNNPPRHFYSLDEYFALEHDREDKFTAYKAIPSFKEYFLIAQDALRISHYIRQEDGRWLS